MIDQETLALDRELNVETELRATIARLDDALDRERAASDEWKAKARIQRDKGHTWRLLYLDLLEKVGKKLDLVGTLPTDQPSTLWSMSAARNQPEGD